MATWKLGPALACGKIVVLEAAEQPPLNIPVSGTLIKQAGFAPSVVNFAHGLGQVAGAVLVGHPLGDKITFSGGYQTFR